MSGRRYLGRNALLMIYCYIFITDEINKPMCLFCLPGLLRNWGLRIFISSRFIARQSSNLVRRRQL